MTYYYFVLFAYYNVLFMIISKPIFDDNNKIIYFELWILHIIVTGL